MQKIMFNDRFDLTEAVLNGRKTMTRRVIPAKAIEYILGEFKQEYFEGTLDVFDSDKKYIEQYYLVEKCGKCFRPGDIVAVAQSYEAAGISFISPPDPQWGCTRDMHGYSNKMFVRADLMPHHIRITSVRIERLQDISNEDCLQEGIRQMTFDTFSFDSWKFFTRNPREAFASLFNRISGKGTWESNPWVFVYEFELVK